MGRIILVASGKGGTGKTTTVANLSAALASLGHLTVAIDMDMGFRNLDIALGIENNIVYDICDVIEGNCTIDDALIKHDTYENLYVISAPQTKRALSFNEEEFAKVMERLKDRFEYCFIDAPAGSGEGFTYALEVAEGVIVVVVPETASLRDADRVISMIGEDKEIRLILNRIRPALIDKGIMLNADECMDMLGASLLGIIAEDDEMLISSLNGELSISRPDTKAGTAFLNIARRLTGEKVVIMKFEEDKGFFKKLKKLFKAE